MEIFDRLAFVLLASNCGSDFVTGALFAGTGAGLEAQPAMTTAAPTKRTNLLMGPNLAKATPRTRKFASPAAEKKAGNNLLGVLIAN